VARTCRKCNGAIGVQSGPGRPRTLCVTCSPRKGQQPVSAPRVTELRPGVAEQIPSLAEATERALRDAGRLTDAGSVVVLEIAKSIDGGGHSGASLASLSREFRAALEAALAVQAEKAADDGVTWDVG